MAQWRRQAFSGTHDPESQDAETLSRVAPVVMYFFAHDTVAVQQAAEAARTTSQAPRVLAACRALALALHAALSGQPKATILARARALSEPLVAPGTRVLRQLRDRGARRRARCVRLDRTISATRCWPPRTSAATRTWWLARAGALAGAHYTAGAIPTLWRNSLMKKQLIEECADRLLAHAMLELAG